MRGTIIAWSGDKGVVTAGSERYDFDIGHWEGVTAPAPDMTVDIATSDGRLTRLSPVSEADLPLEKPAAAVGEGRSNARAILASVGRDVAIAYGVFLALALFVSVVSMPGIVNVPVTLADLLSGHAGLSALTASSGKGMLFVLIATATIAIPYFWRHRLAPLAFAVPLLFTLYGFWPLYKEQRAQREAMEAMGELGAMMGEMAEQMGGNIGGPLDNLAVGAYLLFATVIYLAVRGGMRAFARS